MTKLKFERISIRALSAISLANGLYFFSKKAYKAYKVRYHTKPLIIEDKAYFVYSEQTIRKEIVDPRTYYVGYTNIISGLTTAELNSFSNVDDAKKFITNYIKTLCLK